MSCAYRWRRPHDRPAWEAFVQAHGDDAGYHAWDWQRVFEDAFGHEPVYLIARREDAVAGVLPARADQEPAVRQHTDVTAVPELRRRDGG